MMQSTFRQMVLGLLIDCYTTAVSRADTNLNCFYRLSLFKGEPTMWPGLIEEKSRSGWNGYPSVLHKYMVVLGQLLNRPAFKRSL